MTPMPRCRLPGGQPGGDPSAAAAALVAGDGQVIICNRSVTRWRGRLASRGRSTPLFWRARAAGLGRHALGAVADRGDAAVRDGRVRDRAARHAGEPEGLPLFLGYELITAILDAGGYLIMRVRDGISLPLTENAAAAGCRTIPRLTYLNEPERRQARDRLPLRVAPSTTSSCPAATARSGRRTPSRARCWATRRRTPGTLRQAYTMRRTASETTIGENKTTVTGAGRATTPCLPIRRVGPRLPGTVGLASRHPARSRQRRQPLWAPARRTPLPLAASATAGTAPGSVATVTRSATSSMRQPQVTAATRLPPSAAAAETPGQAARARRRHPPAGSGAPHAGRDPARQSRHAARHLDHAQRIRADHPVPARPLAAELLAQRPGMMDLKPSPAMTWPRRHRRSPGRPPGPPACPEAARPLPADPTRSPPRNLGEPNTPQRQ